MSTFAFPLSWQQRAKRAYLREVADQQRAELERPAREKAEAYEAARCWFTSALERCELADYTAMPLVVAKGQDGREWTDYRLPLDGFTFAVDLDADYRAGLVLHQTCGRCRQTRTHEPATTLAELGQVLATATSPFKPWHTCPEVR